jgi:hypothetical protein
MSETNLKSFDLSGSRAGIPKELAAWSPETWRIALLAAGALAFGVAFTLGQGTTGTADPDLSALLRGMAMLKAAMTAAGAGILWWRLSRPISTSLAAAYVACVTAASAATGLVWTMSCLWAATILFHGALIAFLIMGLRDSFGGSPRKR